MSHGLYMRQNIEVSVNFERGPYINVHAQRRFTECACSNYSCQRPAEVNDWNCRLPFKEDSLREGEWVCHEYN